MATDFELSVMQELGEIKSQGAATATAVTALNERLFNGGTGVIPVIQADIVELKEDEKEAARWDKARDLLHNSIPAGVLVGLHMLAHKLGWKV